MASIVSVANLQGLPSAQFRITLDTMTRLTIHGDLRLNNQSYLPLPSGDPSDRYPSGNGPDARPGFPTYGSVFMNTRTGKLEYFKHGSIGGWEYMKQGGADGDGEDEDSSALYDFTTHTFTNCGQTGDYGPSINQCKSSYSTTWVNDTSLFDMVVQGIQRWTVPETATYEIEVRGATGLAYSSGARRGYGYSLKGLFNLQKGEVVQIAVGQGGWGAGGSGGGTFVVLDAQGQHTPLIIAGGGGGWDGRYSYTNGDSHSSENGKSSSDGYSGGSNGSGGNGPGGNGTAGAGYYTNSNDQRGQHSFLQGGSQPANNSLRGDYNGGGFGGAGGSTDDQGSGGGGYSGGAGTQENSTGGGGGSYFNTTYGTNRNNLGTTSNTHGECKITKG